MLPPIKLFLERRLSNQWRHEFIQKLPSEDVAALISYLNKATGWMFVSSGGTLLAIKENYELIHGLETSIWWFWALCVAMPLLCVLNTTLRIRRT